MARRDCCLLQICCPPEEQRAALAQLFEDEGLDKASAAKASEVVSANWDLAPAGSLLLLKEGIKRAIKGEKD
jgi:hypothetical protein